MTSAFRIRLSGGGDFDVHFVSTILAEALTVYEDKNVVQQVAYGPEARGAAARNDLVIADGEIQRPRSETADLVVTLTLESANRFARTVREGGTLAVEEETGFRPDAGPFRTLVLPFLATARRLGDARLANFVVVGAVAALSPVHDKRPVEEAILGRVPPGTEAASLGAFEAGWALAEGGS